VTLFWVRVATSFIVGGVWLMLVSVIAERLSTRLAGIIGGLPSTLLISLFFIALGQGPDFAAKAVTVTPIAFAINSYFLLMLAVLAHKGYAKAMAVGGLGWLIAIGILLRVHLHSFELNLILWFFGMIGLSLLVRKQLSLANQKGGKVHFTKAQLLARSAFAGAVIAAAVVISKYGGATLGGLATAFPAVFLTTFTILYFARGAEFTKAVAAPLTVSGGINTVIYGMVIYYLYPRWGMYWGTLVAFAVSLLAAYFIVQPLIKSLAAKRAV